MVRNLHRKNGIQYTGKATSTKFALVAAVCLAAPTLLTPARADTNWTNTAGGDWGTLGNWSAGLPTSAVNAVFNAGSNYAITLPGNEATNLLTDTANGVLLQLNAHTLTLNNTLSIGNGTSGSLTIDGGTINQTSGNISLANGTAGSLLLQDGANVTTAGQLLAGSTAGNAGTALTITANSSLSTGTAGLAIHTNSSLSTNVAGTWNVTGTLGIGGLGASTNGGAANLTITGNVTVSGTTDIWNNTTLNGITTGITLAGGVLNTGVFTYISPSSLNWASGTLNITNSGVIIGSHVAGSSYLASNLVIGTGDTLDVSGANMALNVTAGSLDVNGGSVQVSGQLFTSGANTATFESNATGSVGGEIKASTASTVNLFTGASVSGSTLTIVDPSFTGTPAGQIFVNNATLQLATSGQIGGTAGGSSYARLNLQSGSNVTFGSNLTLGTLGMVNMSGGSLAANAIKIGSGSIFSETAGNLTAGNIIQSGGAVSIGVVSHTFAVLSMGRQNIVAEQVGTKVLFAGGGSSVVDIYNSSNGAWTTASLSQSRAVATGISLGSKAFFAGGSSNSGASNVVDIYDNITGQWSNATLSHPAHNLSAATVGNKAIFAGGAVFNFFPTFSPASYSNAVDIYNNATTQWTTATLSQARYGASALSVGTKAIFAGGVSGRSIQNSAFPIFFPLTSSVADIYDDGTGQWSNTTLSQARYSMAAATVGEKAIFAGGSTGITTFHNLPTNIPSNVVDIYNNTTGQWSTASLSEARFNIAATTVENKVLYAGGRITNISSGNNPTVSNLVDIYDNDTDIWSATALSQARESISAVTVGNMAIFAGGISDNGNSNVVDIYDDGTGLWSISTLSQQQVGLAGVSVGNQALFAGGSTSSSLPTNAVDIFNIANATLSFGNGTNNVTAYTLSGGTLSARNVLMNSGGNFTQSGGTLTAFSFNQSGGSTNFSNATPLKISPTVVTAYTLSGGTLNTPSLLIQTNGIFTQTAGTLTTANITQTGGNATFTNSTPLIVSFSNIKSYALSGGTLTTPNATIQTGGSLTLTANGTLSTNSLTLQGTGQLHFDGGSLTAPISGATTANLFLAPANGTFGPSTPLAVLAGGANASYAGTGSSADGDLATSASLLFGTNSSGADTALTMRWRTRTTTESLTNVSSDILDLSGMVNDGTSSGQTDLFVLQISYNPTGLTLAQQQGLFLATSINGLWVNAISGNFGTNTGTQFLGPWTNDADHTQLGAWGVDTTNDMVWAVLNHNTEFAATPEPGTLGILALGLGLLVRKNKNRQHAAD